MKRTLCPVLFLMFCVAVHADPTPLIRHEPVKVAESGQSITLIARVSSDPGPVRTVTLNYTLSRDSAPIKLKMTRTGADVYTATIPAEYFQRSNVLYYFIEAEADGGYWAETTWQAVPVKRVSEANGANRPVDRGSNNADSGISWGTVGIVAGAGVGIAIAAVSLSDSGSDSGGGGNNPPPSTNGTEKVEGTYSGTSTVCFTPDAGGGQTCNSSPATITITKSGNASSSDIFKGTPASGSVNGEDISMDADASQDKPTSTGDVEFNGTVRNGRITGGISGEAVGGNNPGEYSGTFDLSK